MCCKYLAADVPLAWAMLCIDHHNHNNNNKNNNQQVSGSPMNRLLRTI